jgi:Ankyrin repeats (3 copies)
MSCRFRWVACQFDFLRHCLPPGIRRALEELPETLDETYQRALEDIGKAKWKYAHRLFQCITVASRPFRVQELAEFLVFDFEAGQIAKPLEGWRAEDPAAILLSTCTSLISIVKADDSEVVQFSHFSVKEFLVSSRIAMGKETISRYHVLLTPAHTMVAQACLGTLLHLDENVSEDNLKDFPLAEYAAEHWMDHAQFDNVSLAVQDNIKLLFDPSKPYFTVWTWLFDSDALLNPERLSLDPDARLHWMRSERPSQPPGTPLHFAALYDMCEVVEFLIVEHAQDVKAQRRSDNRTPLFIASVNGRTEVTRILLQHGAAANGHDKNRSTPLHMASIGGHLEVALNLLLHDADASPRDKHSLTPLHFASETGDTGITQLLLKHGADVNANDDNDTTPLHLASQGEHLEVVLLLLDHGADASARGMSDQTPLHMALRCGYR